MGNEFLIELKCFLRLTVIELVDDLIVSDLLKPKGERFIFLMQNLTYSVFRLVLVIHGQ